MKDRNVWVGAVGGVATIVGVAMYSVRAALLTAGLMLIAVALFIDLD